MRPVVGGLVLVIALLVVFGAVSRHGHAAVAVSSPRTGAPLATVQGTPVGHGFTLGRVVSNDGVTLKIHALLSGVVTVHADRSTKVLVPMHTSVSQLAVATNIAVYGTRYGDGSLTASWIIGGF
ncbi:hypothetical protein [Nocardia alni]|uniref:hypothetical protein n=1 Tax=Nocardia alni TaxID=2815723 RepID=UPI001C226B71|nr:hypothetical protein [Nocardia alni]